MMKKHTLPLWSLFHENSKMTKHTSFPPNDVIIETMTKSYDSLPYFGAEKYLLSTNLQFTGNDLVECIVSRKSSRDLNKKDISQDSLSTILYCAAGLRRKNDDSNFPVPFRVIPSGGALYPTEVYLYIDEIDGIKQGLYYYNSSEHSIVLVRAGNLKDELKGTLPQNEIMDGATIVLFISAIINKSTFKYGERGYRFSLMEAGHMAQNICLVTSGFSLGSTPIGGFWDDKVNDFLDLDGIYHSALYMVAIG